MSGGKWAALWAEFTQKKLPSIRAKWAAALPTILVSLTLLFSIWGIFGVRYVVMTSFLTLVFRTRHRQDFRPRELARTAVMMAVVCLAAFAAGRGLWWALALNLVVPYVLVYLLSSKFSPKAYFVYGMEFVFLQLVPITSAQLSVQLAVLAYGLAVVTAALWIHARIIHRRRHFGTVRKGMDNLCTQLEKLARGESVSAEHAALPSMMIHMTQVIYGSRGYTYLANGYGKVNYLFMLLFQRFYYFTDHFVPGGWQPGQADAAWLLELAELFRQAERELNGPEHPGLRRRLDQLRAGPGLSDGRQNEAMGEILRVFGAALEALEQVHPARPMKDWKLPGDQNKVKGVRYAFGLDQFTTRFAVRLSAVLCLGFGFVWLTGLEHAYWYPMTAFLMLMPYAEESRMKIGNRILGTLGGAVVSILLMSLFHTMPQYMAIMAVMTCFMYYVPVTSWTMTVYTTCYGMALAQLRLGLMESVELRLAYVALAAVTAALANRFLLPNTARREFQKSVEELFELDLSLLGQVREYCRTGSQDLNRMRDRLVHSHLLENEIKTSLKGMSKAEQEFYSQMLPMNRQLVSELEQINAYLRSRPQLLGTDHSRMAAEVLDNLEDAILRIKLSYTKNELVPFFDTGRSPQAFGRLEESLYFNTLAVNCLQTLRQMNELLESKANG